MSDRPLNCGRGIDESLQTFLPAMNMPSSMDALTLIGRATALSDMSSWVIPGNKKALRLKCFLSISLREIYLPKSSKNRLALPNQLFCFGAWFSPNVSPNLRNMSRCSVLSLTGVSTLMVQ